MSRVEGYRSRDMTQIGKASLAEGVLGLAFLVVGSAVTELGTWRRAAVVEFACLMVAFASERRRLAREELHSCRNEA